MFSTPEALKSQHAIAANHRKTQSLSKDFHVVKAAALLAAEAMDAASLDAASEKSLTLPSALDPSRNLIDDSELEDGGGR